MRSLGLITLALLAPFLVACGGGDDQPGGTETSSPRRPASAAPSAESVGESPDCRVAVTTWADRATGHVLDAVTTAPALAEALELEDLEDPVSAISTSCSIDLADAVGRAMVALGEADSELSRCGFALSCDPPAVTKIRRLADDADALISDVRRRVT